MAQTAVVEAQFEFTQAGLLHTPTGAEFFVFPRHDQPYRVDWRMAGIVLESGDAYQRGAIEEVARRLISKKAKHIG